MIPQLALLIILDEERRLSREPRMNGRFLRDQQDPFSLSSNQFIEIYRLSRESARYLIEKLRPSIRRTSSADTIPLEFKVLSSLQFLGCGSGAGNNSYFNMAQITFKGYLEAVVNAINSIMLKEWIKFPAGHAARLKVKQGFYQISGLRDVIGAIDGTHVGISAPLEDEYVFINRRRFHSINVMIVCDASLKITTINARFPGSSCDSNVWSNSALRQRFETEESTGALNGYILGDRGYPLEPWLITPIRNASVGSSESKFNDAHIKAHCSIKRCIDLWKSRFCGLSKIRTIDFQPITVAKIINASAVLHNLCLQQGENPLQGPDGTGPPVGNIRQRGESVRKRIVERNF